jgi:hypothetical protein
VRKTCLVVARSLVTRVLLMTVFTWSMGLSFSTLSLEHILLSTSWRHHRGRAARAYLVLGVVVDGTQLCRLQRYLRVQPLLHRLREEGGGLGTGSTQAATERGWGASGDQKQVESRTAFTWHTALNSTRTLRQHS